MPEPKLTFNNADELNPDASVRKDPALEPAVKAQRSPLNTAPLSNSSALTWRPPTAPPGVRATEPTCISTLPDDAESRGTKVTLDQVQR